MPRIDAANPSGSIPKIPSNGDPSISLPKDVTASSSAISESTLPFPENTSNPAVSDPQQRRQLLPIDHSILPHGTRSLSSIALHAFCLGLSLSAGLLLTAYLSYNGHQLWRLPYFISALCVFHFLEFYTTARWNTPSAKVSSFLLFSNGIEYNAAQAVAMLEVVISSVLFPHWQTRFSNTFTLLLGLGLVIMGQGVRSIAMAQAGTNFNHIPAREKTEGHELVTSGIYGWLRHPSYFGFFWWTIGTQIVVGNKLCMVAYACVLWRFFARRIEGEEKSLVSFFGKDYEDYRKRAPTGIPFIP